MIKYFLIVIGVFIVIFLVLMVLKRTKREKDVSRALGALCLKYNFKLEKVRDDYLISKGDKRIVIRVCPIPHNSSVTINSRTTWCLRWGGKRYGRGYPNQRYLNELNDFLKLKTSDSKVILLYKTTEKILMYLNESEIASVSEGVKVYDYMVVTFNNLENVFPSLIN